MPTRRNKLYSIAEAMVYMNRSRQTIGRYIQEGRLKATKMTVNTRPKYMIERAEMDRFMKELVRAPYHRPAKKAKPEPETEDDLPVAS